MSELGDMLRKSIIIGFMFGVIISFIAYFSNLYDSVHHLFLIPLLAGIFSGLGGFIAMYVTNLLSKKTRLHPYIISVFSFFVAATFNIAIVMLIISGFSEFPLNKAALLWIFLGLGMGGIYAAYSYKMDQIQERMDFLKALSEKNRQLQDVSRKIAITEERNRMGRELHDSVSQGLHGLIFSIHSLKKELHSPSERIAQILNHMEATSQSTLDELRTMIEELKPSILAEQGLVAALHMMADLFSQRNEIPVTVKIEITDPLSADTEMAIYRISQEALANIEKHALAKNVSLKLLQMATYYHLEIVDDGVGFDYISKKDIGNGLHNICSRTEERGGKLELTSNSNGTSIIAQFPRSTDHES